MTMMLKLREDQERKLKFLEDFPEEAKLLNNLSKYMYNRNTLGMDVVEKKIEFTKKILCCNSDSDIDRWYVKMDGENILDIEFFENTYHEKYYDPTIKYLTNQKKGEIIFMT